MGDYNKLIVNCSLKKMNKDEVELFEKRVRDSIGISSSAYHCGGELLHIDNYWHHRTDFTLVTQAKYGIGVQEFIDWLRPQVIDGMGENETFAIEFSEYDEYPKTYHKLEE